MEKNIINTNNNFEFHGYNEWYWNNGKLRLRTNFKNKFVIGYAEWHQYKQTSYKIK